MKKTPLFQCLIPLLDSLGWRGNNERLADFLNTDAEYSGITSFRNVMASLGYSSTLFRSLARDIEPRIFPCLFIYDTGNIVCLLKEENQGQTLIYDGSSTSYKNTVLDKSEGTVYLFKSIGEEEDSLQKAQPKWFWNILSRFKQQLVLSLFFSFLLSLFALVQPLFVSMIYRQIDATRDKAIFIYLGLGIVLFISGEMIFRFLRSKILRYVSVRLNAVTSDEIFRRLLYFPPPFTESVPIDSQLQRIKDFENVGSFLSGPALSALLDFPFIVILFITLFLLGGSIAVIPLISFLLFFIVALVLYPLVKQVNGKNSKAAGRWHEALSEIVMNLGTIRITSTHKKWLEKAETASAESAYFGYKSANVISLIQNLSGGIVTITGVITLSAGVRGVIEGTFAPASLLAVTMLVWKILEPMRSGFMVITQIDSIRRSITQVNRFMAIKPEKMDPSDFNYSMICRNTIKFQDLSFRYSADGYPILLGVSFQIPENSVFIISGHAGAGKTTLLKLVLGMYTPQSGKIFYGQYTSRQLDPLSLRKAISFLPQNPYILPGTVKDNLLYANPACSDQELENLCRKAGIWDFISSLPDQMETPLGPDLTELPIWFPQGINTVRFLSRKTPLLLIDEPESNNDPARMEALIEIIKEERGQKTIIIVTNEERFKSLGDYEMVLDNGRMKSLKDKRVNGNGQE